jgi:hypothetical protein
MRRPESPATRNLRKRLQFNMGLFAVISAALLVAIIAVFLQGGFFMVVIPALTKLLLISFGLFVLSGLLLLFVNRSSGRRINNNGRYYIDF